MQRDVPILVIPVKEPKDTQDRVVHLNDMTIVYKTINSPPQGDSDDTTKEHLE